MGLIFELLYELYKIQHTHTWVMEGFVYHFTKYYNTFTWCVLAQAGTATPLIHNTTTRGPRSRHGWVSGGFSAPEMFLFRSSWPWICDQITLLTWTDSCWVGFIVAHWITTAAGCLAAKIRWVRPGVGEFVLSQPTLWECLSTQGWEQQCVWTARRLCQSISCISDSLYASCLWTLFFPHFWNVINIVCVVKVHGISQRNFDPCGAE